VFLLSYSYYSIVMVHPSFPKCNHNSPQ
jgi:hypothetical protein